MALTRDSILKHAGTFTTEKVHVPAWRDENGDDEVVVRGMSVREFEVNQASLGKSEGTATAALVARCVLDENNQRIFTDADINQIAELGFGQVNEIGKAISKLSGLDDDAPGDVDKAVDAAGKDSAATTGDSSSSVSPATSPSPSPTSPTA